MSQAQVIRNEARAERYALHSFKPSTMAEATDAEAWGKRLVADATARVKAATIYAHGLARACADCRKAYDAAPTAAAGFPGAAEAAAAAWSTATSMMAVARMDLEREQTELDLASVMAAAASRMAGCWCEANKA